MDHPRPPRRRPNQTLLVLACILGTCALFFTCFILGLQLQVYQKQLRLLELRRQQLQHKKLRLLELKHDKKNHMHPRETQLTTKSDLANAGTDFPHATIKPSDPTNPNDLYLGHASQPPTGTSRTTAAQAYWNQFILRRDPESLPWTPLDQSYLGDFDPVPEDAAFASYYNQSIPARILALQQAARLGHPQAQHYLANALSSGVWPVRIQPTNSSILVSDQFFSATPQKHLLWKIDNNNNNNDQLQLLLLDQQQQQAWLLWHMAATAGHLESAMALALRYDALYTAGTTQPSTRNSTGTKWTCDDVLPYYAAAAHAIVDILEANPHSRAKVQPPQEQHLLYQVHLHGGTSSQLDAHNKQPMADDAIEFYHWKATQYKGNHNSKKKRDNPNSAAYTLAQLYHYGAHGVTQNLTLALHYYDLAAKAGHKHAAGHAGWFHIWSMGMEPHQRNLTAARQYFQQGIVPGGWSNCHLHWKISKSKDPHEQEMARNFVQCDKICLNGMGMLHLLGVPGEVYVDENRAMKYLELAKDMGNPDAAYNLGMVKLGWKSHFVSQKDAPVALDEGMCMDDPASSLFTTGMESCPIVKVGGKLDDKSLQEIINAAMKGKQFDSAPSPLELKQAIQYLNQAASKGHMQARHRLGLMLDAASSQMPEKKADGSPVVMIKHECPKALQQYRLVVQHASPPLQERLRKAYNDYAAGDIPSSLLHYMATAELGNRLAQLNAAFLLEQGHCLGMTKSDCTKASVRLWKAAADAGNDEACLRVGDFYYYGKLRPNPKGDDSLVLLARPYGIFQYVIYPELHLLPKLTEFFRRRILDSSPWITQYFAGQADNPLEQQAVGDIDSSGLPKAPEYDDQADLSMAAHYYRMAAEEHSSPRAFFNLGFLYEWGLGVKQDFPLAKRHYDLAATHATAGQAELAVRIALYALKVHQYALRLGIVLDDIRYQVIDAIEIVQDASFLTHGAPSPVQKMMAWMTPSASVEDLEPGETQKTTADILWSHFVSWESLIIFVLTAILWVLIQKRREQTQAARR